MSNPFQKIAVLFVALIGAAAIAVEPNQSIAVERKVMSVDEVTVRTVEGKPAQLTIDAVGMVNSGGWTRPALRPGNGPAAEGTLVFEFVALPPSGPATMALAPIKATVTVEKPAAYRGVQVVAQSNTKTAK